MCGLLAMICEGSRGGLSLRKVLLLLYFLKACALFSFVWFTALFTPPPAPAHVLRASGPGSS